jgi:hypothetical protein
MVDNCACGVLMARKAKQGMRGVPQYEGAKFEVIPGRLVQRECLSMNGTP